MEKENLKKLEVIISFRKLFMLFYWQIIAPNKSLRIKQRFVILKHILSSSQCLG